MKGVNTVKAKKWYRYFSFSSKLVFGREEKTSDSLNSFNKIFFNWSGVMYAVLACLLLNTPVLFAADTSNEEEKPDSFCLKVKGHFKDRQGFKKHISKLKKKCQGDYESVQGYCTQEGLANIQAVSAGGQAISQTVSVLKADGTPKSARNAMNMSKTVSYGLGALNSGIGAKCLANIKSCSKACGEVEKTKGCLEEMTSDQTYLTGEFVRNPESAADDIKAGITLIQEEYIEPLSKQDSYKAECKKLTSNAIAALAQGALHGVTGAIQGEIAKTFGQKDAEDEGELEEIPTPEPNLPSTPTLGGNPNPWTPGTKNPSGGGAGSLAGNQNPPVSDTPPGEDDIDFDPNEYVGSEEGIHGGFTGNSGSSGGSRAPASLPRFGGSGSLGDGGGDTGSFDDEEIDPEGTFSSGGGYGGDFQGSSSNHYGSGGGYGYADDETGSYGGIKTPAKSPAEKKKEELERLKASIGGKHENIFEKASKILSAYCMEGPLKCE